MVILLLCLQICGMTSYCFEGDISSQQPKKKCHSRKRHILQNATTNKSLGDSCTFRAHRKSGEKRKRKYIVESTEKPYSSAASGNSESRFIANLSPAIKNMHLDDHSAFHIPHTTAGMLFIVYHTILSYLTPGFLLCM